MLYLTRKVGESVIINENIEVTVVEVRGRSIKLGFTFPPHVSVLRREIFERIQAENRAAADPVDGSALPDILPSGIGVRLGRSTQPAEGRPASSDAAPAPQLTRDGGKGE